MNVAATSARPRVAASRARVRPRGLGGLAPPIDIDGPRVRLGLAWAALTFAALVPGGAVLGAWLALHAAAAAGQASRSWRRRPARPWRPLAVFGAAAVVLAAAAGVVPFAVVVVVVAGMGIAAPALAPTARGRPARSPELSAIVPLACAVPAGAVVLVRDESFAAAFVLLALAAVHDASVYVMGSGVRRRWEAHVSATAAVASVTVLAAAVLVPPFRDAGPWVLGALAAVLLPAGTLVATLLLGDRSTPVPALRRLDSLLLLGPVWALLAPLLLE